MTDYVNPSNSFRPLSEEMGRLFRYSGHIDSFIAEGTTLVSDVDSVGVSAGPHGAFEKVSTSGLTFTIDSGEAMVHGALLARDTETPVSLPPSDAGTIFLAWNPGSESDLIIDHDQSGNVTDHPRIPLYDFTTDTSNVSMDEDVRVTGEHIGVRNKRYETSDGSGMAVDQADNATKLGGNGPSYYAASGQNETIAGRWLFSEGFRVDSNYQDGPTVEIVGANAVDGKTLVVTSDADGGQDDDALWIRGVLDPQNDTPSEDDTILVSKGDGRTGINTYDPAGALDVDGDTHLRQVLDMHHAPIHNPSRIDIIDGDDGFRLSSASTGSRSFIAPIFNDNVLFDSELTYYPSIDEWEFETSLRVNSDFNVSGHTFFADTVHFQKNQAEGFVLENRSNRPGSPSVGQMIYRTDKD